MIRRSPIAFLIASLMALVTTPVFTLGCGDSAAPVDSGFPDGNAPDVVEDAGPDPSEELFGADHILEIEITMDPADWAVLREQPDVIGSGKITCDEQPVERAYTYFPADITIDGVTTSNVGVRKKGGFGSISSARPGLKVKPSEYEMGQRISGLTRLTLNNNVQDPSLISQCLGYGLFRQAGVPASRCSFAHVTVNGEDLGIYSNVESLKKPFIARHFDDNDGRLYESGGEFLPGRIGGFQPKTNKSAPDCSDLPPVMDALGVPDADFPAAIDAVVDVDAFMTYWAMEVLMDHWDGYANNQNNYFFYHDPTSDKFHFIPWGIDALFTGRERTSRPDSVYACGSLTWRLYDVPETRALYLARLRELLAGVWDEAAILVEIDRMQALLEPIADPRGGEWASAVQRTRDFVGARRGVLLGELDAGDPVWPFPQEESCRVVVGDVSATFDTTWDTLGDFGAGTSTMDGTVSGVSLTSMMGGVSMSGLSDEDQAIVQLFAPLSDGRFGVVFVIVQDPANFRPGTLNIDLVNVAAIMTFFDPDTDTTSGGGLILNGALRLTSASQDVDAAVVGSLSGDVFEL